MKEIVISFPARIVPPPGGPAPFGYPQAKMEEITVARGNRSQILLAAQEIERHLTFILERYLFQKGSEQGLFFAAYISGSDWFSFNQKRLLVEALLRQQQQISKQDKDELIAHLKKIIHWRNMFTHGDIFAKDDGIYIEYFEGKRQEVLLSDEYLDNIVTWMERTPKLLREIKWPTA